MAQPDFTYRYPAASSSPWKTSRSASTFFTPSDPYQDSNYEQDLASPPSVLYPPTSSTYHLPSAIAAGVGIGPISSEPGLINNRPELASPISSQAYHLRHSSGYKANGSGSSFGHTQGSYVMSNGTHPRGWEMYPGRQSPSDSMDDIINSPHLSEHSLDVQAPVAVPVVKANKPQHGKNRSQRRPSNRDEFDGPHQFLQRPPPEYIAMQERELPHLPTNLLVQEQDSILTQVNDRLSQCAYDFVAKYQFPIPLTQDMRPVERPQDREWTEWVYLLKRLATKRRIPARVLYNGQIKQFVTVLENSLEMRHAAKHQSRPLKDDRNILQLISAGIQVAKILKDASAMDYLDKLYVSTEKQIQERSAAAAARFR